ncbi:hypothetical protein KR222_002506 [Zaprionus bogoriensis]|nr:hypothetical protein KR222_002506 [Zaprionus bogoriensis]
MATEAATNGDSLNLANSEEDVICPSCDAKIKRSQVADHCQVEVERLHSMQALPAAPATVTVTTQSPSPQQVGELAGNQRRPWSVFQRVQRNRQARQRQRTRKRPTPPPAPPPAAAPAAASQESTRSSTGLGTGSGAGTGTGTCPVCSKNFPQAQLQEHANLCLRQSNGEQRASSDEDEDSEEYEEYEWAGQKRIRVSTLVQGGYGALNLGQTIRYNGGQQANEDEDDVNVDEDDTHIYGPTQYGEADVIPLAHDDAEEGGTSEAEAVTSYVRRLISSSDAPKNHSTSEEHCPPVDEAMEPSTSHASASASLSAPRASRSSHQNQQQIIESLKARLRLYEKQAQSKFKCLICIDDYKNPAISVSCWHVHCEQCWLQTLGARKLCPQCNSITTPKDLRRIYL